MVIALPPEDAADATVSSPTLGQIIKEPGQSQHLMKLGQSLRVTPQSHVHVAQIVQSVDPHQAVVILERRQAAPVKPDGEVVGVTIASPVTAPTAEPPTA